MSRHPSESGDRVAPGRRRGAVHLTAALLASFALTACGDKYGEELVTIEPHKSHTANHGGLIYTLGPGKDFAHIEIVHLADEGGLRTHFTGPDGKEPTPAGEWIPVEVSAPESKFALKLLPVEMEGAPANTVYGVTDEKLKGLEWFQLKVEAVTLRGENISGKTFKFRHPKRK